MIALHPAVQWEQRNGTSRLVLFNSEFKSLFCCKTKAAVTKNTPTFSQQKMMRLALIYRKDFHVFVLYIYMFTVFVTFVVLPSSVVHKTTERTRSKFQEQAFLAHVQIMEAECKTPGVQNQQLKLSSEKHPWSELNIITTRSQLNFIFCLWHD